MTEVTINVEITEQDFEDIAFASATCYWNELYRRTDGELVGLEVCVLDEMGEVGAVHEVTYDDLREAFARLVSGKDANGNRYNVGAYILDYFHKAVIHGDNGGIDCGFIDDEAADVWLQIAIWDYTIYG